MASNFQLSGGTTPRRRDTRWFAWARQLFKWQARGGSDPAFDPQRSDTRLRLTKKVLNSLTGEGDS